MEPEQLRGWFVVEVGVRQAWPFLTLADGSSKSPTDARLYIDTEFRLDSGAPVFTEGDPHPAVVALLDLSNLSVTDAQVRDTAELMLAFEDGNRILVVSGTGMAFTSGPPWWLSLLHRPAA